MLNFDTKILIFSVNVYQLQMYIIRLLLITNNQSCIVPYWPIATYKVGE